MVTAMAVALGEALVAASGAVAAAVAREAEAARGVAAVMVRAAVAVMGRAAVEGVVAEGLGREAAGVWAEVEGLVVQLHVSHNYWLAGNCPA